MYKKHHYHLQLFRQFHLFCLIGVVSSPLAQTPAQQLLQNGIFKIVLLAEDKEVLLADKVEFDPNGNSLFFINRKDAAIEFREQAWRWVGQAQDEVLQLDLSSKNRFDISFKRLDDKILEGDVSKKSSGYQELVRLLGKDPQEMKIRFYKLLFNPRTNRNQTLQGK